MKNRIQPNRSKTFLKNGNWTLLGVAILAHQKGFVLLTREWSGSREKYIWQCPDRHQWTARIDSLIEGKGCPECYKRKILTSEERVSRKRQINRTYYTVHKKEKREYDRAYEYNRRRSDPKFKLVRNMRARIRMAVRSGAKAGSSVRDLGCSIEDFKNYIETKFVPGMDWENWSRDGWHLDHIRPLSSFDLTDRNQFLKAVHYTNFQPLWAKDNLSKGSKLSL